MTKTEYVVGFAYDSVGRVVLIRKTRPTWQAGKLNGVGGKIEAHETAKQAMAREFEEETGVQTLSTAWRHVGTMIGAAYVVHILAFESDTITLEVATTTDEPVVVRDGRRLPEDCLPNVPYLVGMAMDRDLTGARLVYGLPEPVTQEERWKISAA
jgi:8-oxo-dGTP diphosphatase